MTRSPATTPVGKPGKDKRPKSKLPSAVESLSRRKSSTRKSVRKDGNRTLGGRFRPGVKALREIKLLQKSTNLLIPKASFVRVIREILLSFYSDVNRIQSEAVKALQEAAEIYLTHLFEDALLLATHAKRVTLFHNDIRLVKRLRGVNDPGNI